MVAYSQNCFKKVLYKDHYKPFSAWLFQCFNHIVVTVKISEVLQQPGDYVIFKFLIYGWAIIKLSAI